MTIQQSTILIVVFIIGLVIGANLGVLLMCLLRIASDDCPMAEWNQE